MLDIDGLIDEEGPFAIVGKRMSMKDCEEMV